MSLDHSESHNDSARRTALIWGAFGVAEPLFSIGSSGVDWGILIIHAIFWISILCVFLGQPSRVRAILAVLIFVVGYIGGYCALLASLVVQAA